MKIINGAIFRWRWLSFGRMKDKVSGNFNIEKEDINPDNLDNLIDILRKIKNYYYIQKSEINLDDMRFICEFKKIAN